MIKSKTKYEAAEAEIRELFKAKAVGEVTGIGPLGDGEFNAAYRVSCADGRDYVLKIAPPEGATVLTYEKNMMASEIFWYRMMKEHTDILCPDVYASDLSGKIIKSPCFIMQLMKGEPIAKLTLSKEEEELVSREKIGMLTKIHRISNDGFGYIQTGLHASWYEALKSMAINLVDDCISIGEKTPDGERFIEYIDKYEQLLKDVPCRMVNFDLWDSNVLFYEGKLCWIDPERGFWGDPVADFITLGPGQKAPLDAKQKEIDIYNSTADEKIVLSDETSKRYAFAVCYLALIEEVEKYVRYEPDEPNYIRNTKDARDMYDMAFDVLDRS